MKKILIFVLTVNMLLCFSTAVLAHTWYSVEPNTEVIPSVGVDVDVDMDTNDSYIRYLYSQDDLTNFQFSVERFESENPPASLSRFQGTFLFPNKVFVGINFRSGELQWSYIDPGYHFIINENNYIDASLSYGLRFNELSGAKLAYNYSNYNNLSINGRYELSFEDPTDNTASLAINLKMSDNLTFGGALSQNGDLFATNIGATYQTLSDTKFLGIDKAIYDVSIDAASGLTTIKLSGFFYISTFFGVGAEASSVSGNTNAQLNLAYYGYDSGDDGSSYIPKHLFRLSYGLVGSRTIYLKYGYYFSD